MNARVSTKGDRLNELNRLVNPIIEGIPQTTLRGAVAIFAAHGPRLPLAQIIHGVNWPTAELSERLDISIPVKESHTEAIEKKNWVTTLDPGARRISPGVVNKLLLWCAVVSAPERGFGTRWRRLGSKGSRGCETQNLVQWRETTVNKSIATDVFQQRDDEG